MAMNRREFVRALGASAFAAALPIGLRPASAAAKAKVVVIGAGFGGATVAKYLRLWAPEIDVSLVERDETFVSCPVSNLVLGGSRTMNDITKPYFTLQSRHRVRIVREEAIALDVDRRRVLLKGGDSLDYDRLIIAPGVEFMWESLPGMEDPAAQEKVLHAWKAGPQTLALRRQLEAMEDGGVFAISVPRAPYRCPPGPYERACQVAHYFSQAKPKSKVLVLDANEDLVSKKDLFTKAWKERYPGMIEYRNNSELQDVDVAGNTFKLQFEDVKADVLNIVPPVRAGAIARQAGLVTANARWCEVDWLTYESKIVKNVHVLGDALLAANAMPKSGHMANQQGKACASAVIALLRGTAPFDTPMLANTCYSFVSDKQAIHVSSVHRYHAEKKTMLAVDGSGGVSAEASELEARYANSWAQNIWADMFA
jgi:sulfide dehydrogenase [flavocytochrome c] flavoprotein chain